MNDISEESNLGHSSSGPFPLARPTPGAAMGRTFESRARTWYPIPGGMVEGLRDNEIKENPDDWKKCLFDPRVLMEGGEITR
ncbi:hypothetical protein CVT25_009341 [Psilocybe cyanescens]|uniref:Uncharacterized protein n=1 Tax=Psilocybe cyanescens TaxID=93625 RepID=A0A409VN98_PSICY|nr:hypothetical protein CVT25_009341 [Psilocybe cyanescens]